MTGAGPQPRSARDLQLGDIPAARVQAAVKELLDLDDLRDVVEVQIGFRVVRAVLHSRDSDGQKFADGDVVATHTITRRVAWS